MRILIAEDEKDLNHILVQKLTQDGYSVDNCYDGQEAMDILTYTGYYDAKSRWICCSIFHPTKE